MNQKELNLVGLAEDEPSLSDLYEAEVESESICDLCGLSMKALKRKRRNKYDKERTVYICSCGHQFRKRTQNEILRDLGKRE